MFTGDQFLGQPIEYWLELQARIEKDEAYTPRACQLLAEVHQLRGQLAVVKHRADEITSILGDPE